ncbi:MAG: hypothetical protein V4813_14045 [Gemmatimonadota bacterium]
MIGNGSGLPCCARSAAQSPTRFQSRPLTSTPIRVVSPTRPLKNATAAAASFAVPFTDTVQMAALPVARAKFSMSVGRAAHVQ